MDIFNANMLIECSNHSCSFTRKQFLHLFNGEQVIKSILPFASLYLLCIIYLSSSQPMFYLLYQKVNVDASPACSRALRFITNYIHFATFFVIYNYFVKLLIFFLTCKIKMGVRNHEIYCTSTYYVFKNMNTECMHTFNAQTLRLFTTMWLFRICKKNEARNTIF